MNNSAQKSDDLSGFVPPPLPRDTRVWQGTVLLMLALSLLFPLTALTFVVLILLDYLVLSRIQLLRTVLK